MTQAAAPPTAVPRALRAVYLAPAAVAVLAYLTALGAGFTLDDYFWVYPSPMLEGGSLRFSLTEPTVSPAGEHYRPLGFLSFAVDHLLFGSNPAGYHAVSVLWHVLATALVVALTRRLVAPAWREGTALVAGLLFAAHPVHVEAVTALTNRTGVMAASFCMAALLVHLRPAPATRAGSAGRLALENALALCGLWCKESALVLPLWLLAVGWFHGDRGLRWSAPLRVLPAVAVFWHLKTGALGGVAQDAAIGFLAGEPLDARLFTVLAIVGRYASLLVVPAGLSASYYQPVLDSPWHPDVAAGAVVVAATALGILWARRRHPAAAVGLAMCAAGLAPFLHLLPLMVSIADRFLYFPSVGFSVAAGYGLVRLGARVGRPALRWAALGALVAALTAATAARNLVWESPRTLWEATVASDPENAFAWANLGLALARGEDADLGAAAGALERAVAMVPAHLQYRQALVQLLHALGAHAREAEVARAGLEYYPGDEALLGGLHGAGASTAPAPRRPPEE